MRHALWMGFSLLLLGGCGGTEKVVTPGAMPQGGTFTGVWFSPQYGEMHMVQTGATVVGKYEKAERTGRIQGHVTGDLMRFQWTEKREMIAGRPTETTGRGYFRIVFDEPEGVYKFVGEWGHDQQEMGGGPWNGVKSKKRKPDLGGGGAAAASSSSDSSGYEGTDVTEDWDAEDSTEAIDEDLGDL